MLPGQCQPLLDQYVRYIGRTPAGSWMASSVRIDASPMCVNASIPRDLAPRLLVTGRGNPEICALWHGFRPSNVAEEVWISCSDDPALGWPSPPRNVSRSEEGQEVSIWPAGVADRMGNLHVVWQERTIDDSYTDYQIYYARSQRMALPAVFRLN